MSPNYPHKHLHKSAYLNTLCEDELGSGAFRTVYSMRWDKNLVIKIERDAKRRDFHNVLEWRTWYLVKSSPIEKWFAECVWMSNCGLVLVQKRTTPVKKLPAKLPSFFTDVKTDNFGMFEDRLVCHDYGYSNFVNVAMDHFTMKTVPVNRRIAIPTSNRA